MVRRTLVSLFWIDVRMGSLTRSFGLGSGLPLRCESEVTRAISSTKSASPPMSGRQGGGEAEMVPSATTGVNPSSLRMRTCSGTSTFIPINSSTRPVRSEMWRLSGITSPSHSTSDASPPQISRIIRVASSRPSRANSGSTPLSNR